MENRQVTQRQTIEQERGRQAWNNIRNIKDKGDKKLEQEYRSLARGLNAMIQINGLGQTLGFLKAKGKNDKKKPHYQLLLHLTTWMQEPKHFKALNSKVMEGYDDGLLRWITDPGTSSDDYRRATTECLAFGAWLRRFAEGELEEPETGDNTK
jgi:CRISPR-associated protein Cmr5